MPIGSLAIYLAMAGLAFAEGPSRGQGWWRRIAVLILGGVVVSLVIESGFNTHTLFHSPPVLDGIAGATAVVIAVDVIGLPLPVARRLHLGLHRREWEFDRRLSALAQQARRVVEHPALAGGPPERELATIIARISTLRAPDEDWALVRDGWAKVWQRHLDLLSKPAGAAAREEALARQRDLLERTELLRVRYRTDASRILGKGS